jgi:hypothetical protein
MNYLPSYHTRVLRLQKTTVLFVVLEPNTGLGRLVIKVSRTHTIRRTHARTHTHSVGLLWTSDRLIAESANYAKHNKLSRIRTRDPSNQADAEICELGRTITGIVYNKITTRK